MAKFEDKVLASGTRLPLINLKGKPYLQVAHRVVWFRETYPNGTINTTLLSCDGDGKDAEAVFKAEIFIPDARGQMALLSTGTKAETRGKFGDFREKAETGSIGRALALAGFGTQFEPEFDEKDRLADAPITIATKTAPDDIIAAATAKANAEIKKKSSFRVATKETKKVEDNDGF